MHVMDIEKIGIETLRGTMISRIQELELKGLVDHNFRQCYSLKEDSGPSFFLDLIHVFLKDVHTEVKDMEETLNQPVVDFKKMFSHFIKLKGSSSCFGACRIKDACSTLHEVIMSKSVEGCFHVLSNIKHEYDVLHEHLDGIRKIEWEVVRRPT